MTEHRLIYADPPWKYRQGGRGAACNHYECLPMPVIAGHLHKHGNPAKDCSVALWQTWPMESEQDALMHGLKWKKITLLFLWIKTTKNGKTAVGGGLAGTRANTEPCFLWRRGRPLKRHSASEQQLIYAPSSEHSRKPAEARMRLERLYGDVPRIELYARGIVPGWGVWGDQADGSSIETKRKDQ